MIQFYPYLRISITTSHFYTIFSLMVSFNFAGVLQVRLNSKSLSTVLTITNTDKKPFFFTTALHTYFSVRAHCFLSYAICFHFYIVYQKVEDVQLDIYITLIILQASVSGASVKGLKGCRTLNKDPDPSNPLEGTEERFVLACCSYLYFVVV